MGASHQRQYDEPVAAINVTPLVDVMLVLLVIFMITAPILQQGVEVNLPKATTAPLPGTAEQIVVSLTKDGKVFVGDGNEVSLDTLAAKVGAIMKTRGADGQKVYIKADQTIEYGALMEVMSRLHTGGITQIGLVSDPTPEPAKSGRKGSARE